VHLLKIAVDLKGKLSIEQNYFEFVELEFTAKMIWT
jgi:hypothetical protein